MSSSGIEATANDSISTPRSSSACTTSRGAVCGSSVSMVSPFRGSIAVTPGSRSGMRWARTAMVLPAYWRRSWRTSPYSTMRPRLIISARSHCCSTLFI